MKTIYYSVIYNDGLKQFFEKQVNDNYNENLLKEKIFESGGIRDYQIYKSIEEFEQAKL